MQSIMITALGYQDGAVIDAIDEAVFGVDPPRPPAGQLMLQGFGLADTVEWIPIDVSDQHVDPFDYLRIGSLPIDVVFPSIRVERHADRLSQSEPGWPVRY